ncbi:MAG: hypothetical protein JO115_18760 [Pseudonocardiales bacterium]|nr:hypothetical protein [Pseudonocardiales bacterium]
MTMPSREQLREWSAELTLGPLDPADPKETRYVPLAEAGRAAVDELRATIELAIDTTTQLLSGPSGSGKTTELYRLRGRLESAGYHVAIFDIGSYVNESSPIDVTEFLIALALGAHDVLGGPEMSDAEGGPGFVGRLRRLLERLRISVDVPGLSASVSRDGVEFAAMGTSVELELQRELKSSESVVAELRSKLTYHLGQLYQEVADFLRTLLPADDPGQGSVLIVDGLEKLRGTTENDVAVQESVQALFVTHASKLKFRSHHMVYTVPTSLQFISPGALPFDSRVLPVPVPHVRPRPGQPAGTVATTIAQLREVVARRLPADEIFTGQQLDQVIEASGGHLRDLFTLLRQVVNLTLRRSLTLPLRDEHVEEAIGLVAHDFMKMTAEQKAFLRQVAAGDGTVDPQESEVPLMARLLQSHMLLGHLNGQDWYEVHPLARRALGLP